MKIGTKQLRVLKLLSENLNNPHPQLVRSNDIASSLNMSLKDTHLLLKIMDHMGVIKIHDDNYLSLITPDGIQYLQEHTLESVRR